MTPPPPPVMMIAERERKRARSKQGKMTLSSTSSKLRRAGVRRVVIRPDFSRSNYLRSGGCIHNSVRFNDISSPAPLNILIVCRQKYLVHSDGEVKFIFAVISGQVLHPPPPQLPPRGRGSPTGSGGTAVHGPLNKNQHSGAAAVAADHDNKSRQKKQVVGPSLPQPQTQPKQQQQQQQSQSRRPKAGLRPPPPPPPPGVLHHHPRPRPVICPYM